MNIRGRFHTRESRKKEKGLLWGVFLKKRTEMELAEVTGDIDYEYTVRLGRYYPHFWEDGKIFFTSPIIRKRILVLLKDTYNVSEILKKQRGKIGQIGVRYYPSTNVLHTGEVDPFSELHSSQRKLLEGIGLASLAEKWILKDLKKTYPNAKVVSGLRATEVRLKQIEKQGRKAGEWLPIDEAHERIRQYVLSKHKKFATKKSIIHRLFRN